MPRPQVHRDRRQSSGRTPKSPVPCYSSEPPGASSPVPPPRLLRPASAPAPALRSSICAFHFGDFLRFLHCLFLYYCCCRQLLLLLLPQIRVFNMDPSPLLIPTPETPTSAHHLMGASELRTSEACSTRWPPSPETPASVSSSYWPSP